MDIKSTGAVDNAALRSVTGLDTLAASQVLGRLHHQRQLLIKGGAGPATYYQLRDLPDLIAAGPNVGGLSPNAGELPVELWNRLTILTAKARADKLWPVILWLCAIQPHNGDMLATLLNRTMKHLKANHLIVLRKLGLLDYLHPEVINHPDQAYVTTEAGRKWLKDKGIKL